MNGSISCNARSWNNTLQEYGDDTLLLDQQSIKYYNSVNTIGIGRPGGGSMERAIRITPIELSGFHNWYFTTVRFFLSALGGRQATLRIYEQGTPNNPGSLLVTKTVSVKCPEWKQITLDENIQIDASQDYWISIEMYNEPDEYPQGADTGPAVDGKGDWQKLYGIWQETQYDTNNTVDRNWNIEAIVKQFKPTAFFSNNPLHPDINQDILFDATDSTDENGYIVNYAWDFGDGTTQNGMVVSHSYPQKMCYDATLIVTDNDGHTDMTYRGIKVGYHPPTAAFTYSPSQPQIQTEILFDASESTDIDGTIMDYTWYFGDNETGNGQQVAHTYDHDGTFFVELFVTDDDGEIGYAKKPIIITNQGVPIAVIDEITPNPAYTNTSVFFQGHGEDEDGDISIYHWTSSIDGMLSEEASFHSNNLSLGNHTIGFQVMDDDGQWSVITTISLEILKNDNMAPCRPDITGPSTGKPGIPLLFYVTASDPDGDQLWYAFDWDEPDQEVSWVGPYESNDTIEVSHIWMHKDVYNIRVKARDENGSESNWSEPIQLNLPRNRVKYQNILYFFQHYSNLDSLFKRNLRIISFLFLFR